MDATYRRVVNALIPGAPMALWAKLLLYWAVYPTIRASGGLWVGGTLTVADGRVRFEANRLNRLFLAADVSFAVGLDEIRSVRVDPGFGTSIVVIETTTVERRVRGFDSTAIAMTIDAARVKTPAG